MKIPFFHKILNPTRRPEVMDIPPIKVLSTYLKMRDEDILNVLKLRYTNNLIAHFSANEPITKERLKGRVLELDDLIDCIEKADDQLLEAKEYARKHEERSKLMNPIKEKLLSFRKQKQLSSEK